MEYDMLEHILEGKEKPTNLSFALLKKITDDFSEEREIGQGGFGTVYKIYILDIQILGQKMSYGVLRNRNVAVKRIMNNYTIDEKLFYREVDSLLKVNHKNVVRFLGFCANTEQAVIKIEDELRGLEWNVRFQIIKDICEGLFHLHMENHIIHMDLKPANILLDHHMVPKVTDFGLSRLDENSQTMCTNRFLSLGYCAPEYLHGGRMSVKSDIYSLGVIIIELVTGHKSIPDNNNEVVWPTPPVIPTARATFIALIGVSTFTMWAMSLYFDMCQRPLRTSYPVYEISRGEEGSEAIHDMGLILRRSKEVQLQSRWLTHADGMLWLYTVVRRWRHRWKKSGNEMPLGYQQENDPYRRPFISDILCDFTNMEGTNEQFSSNNGSTIDEMSAYLEDDMLGIEPLELHFPFDLNKQMACTLQLTNETDGCIAFNIQTTSPLPYRVHPTRDIVPPRSKCSIDITLQLHKKAPWHAGGLIVRSTKVSDGLAARDITTDMFDKEAGNLVDEVSLDVVFDRQLQASHLSEVPKHTSLAPVAVLGTNDPRNRGASSVPRISAHTGSEGTVSEVIPAGSSKLLDIHPPELWFTFEPNKLIPCSLYLTNNTDEYVPFKLMEKSMLMHKRRLFLSLPLYGIVPPGSAYILVVTTDKRENLPEERDVDFVLQNSVGDERLKPFRNQYDCDQYFEKATKSGNMVHNVILKVVYAPEGKMACESLFDQMTFVEKTHAALCSLDANQTEPWIITGHYDGRVGLWDYDTQAGYCSSSAVSTSRINISTYKVTGCLVKFIERRQWFLAGSYHEGFIHVYNYETEVQEVNSFRAHDRFLESMAIHPTQPYVLSSSDTQIKLWDWDKDWECRRTFMEHSHTVKQVAFNPWNTNSFASASRDHTAKVWSLDSSRSMYTLSGHLDEVNCLDFFTRDNQQYLITGSEDMTAKIWDLRKEMCIETLKGFMFPVVSIVSHPRLPLVIIGTRNGIVHLWSLTNFRVERILHIGCHQGVRGLAALMGSRRWKIMVFSASFIYFFISLPPIFHNSRHLYDVLHVN
ncbi:Putative coatomer subunit beta'-3 [Triticum urartu]|uniref:Putative coatomer subunit beta'-3 n=1 Tax=Triticum urartu TaxID=4572 RepID=M8AJC1_TRIUA|nr:Putative coatomer subunit beta'-3 [Triticum urartu]